MMKVGDRIVMIGTCKWAAGRWQPTSIRTIVRVGARLAKWGPGPDDGVGAEWTSSTPEEIREAEAILAARNAQRKRDQMAVTAKEADPLWQVADRVEAWFGARGTDAVMLLGLNRLLQIEIILAESAEEAGKELTK